MSAVRTRVMVLVLGLTLAAGAAAHADPIQVSPLGSDDTTVGPGTGLQAPVSATGGYQTAVPLDLPSPRGRFTIPLAIRYTGGTDIGAAGAGWDVPLSYVWRSTNTWHRKPAALGTDDVAPERVFLTLGGSTLYMVQSDRAGVYVPFLAAQYMELREEGDGSWTLDTANGIAYRFTELNDARWLLTRIEDRIGTDHAELHYETTASCDSTSIRGAPELASVAYTFDDGEHPLYEIQLVHEPWWVDDLEDGAFEKKCAERTAGGVTQTAPVLGYSTGPTGVLEARAQITTKVVVHARNNLEVQGLGSSSRVVRTYQLGYAADPDTGEPRLTSVDVTGEDEQGNLPGARFTYGHATRDQQGGDVVFGAAIFVGCGSIATGLDGSNLDHLTSLSVGRGRGSGLGTSRSA